MPVEACVECGGSYPAGEECGFCKAKAMLDTNVADHVLRNTVNAAIVAVLEAAEEELLRGWVDGMTQVKGNFPGVFAIVMPEPAKRFMDSPMGKDAFGEFDTIVWAEGTECFVLGAGLYVIVPLPDFVTTWEKF